MMIKNANQSFIGESEVSGVQTCGNPDTFCGLAIVGFVDLLGFSASVKATWNDPKNSPLDRIMRIKETAERAGRSTIAVAADKSAPPKVKEAYRSRIHTVSDSIIICSALPSEEPAGDDFFYSCANLIFGIQVLWERAVDEGYTIRGAVELGEIYWTPADTIGPALVDAYKLENKIACWSRVIVGPALLREAIKLTDRTLDQLSDFLAVSPDRLIELSPFRLTREHHLQPMEKMEAAAGISREKYRHLLSILRGENQIIRATRVELERGVVAIEEQMMKHCRQAHLPAQSLVS
jgi:hypothetical protein